MKKLLVNLDTLLDTRLGALISINPDFAYDISSKDTYYNRQLDEFSSDKLGTLNKDIFKNFHTKNKQLCLRNSIKTKMPRFIFELLNTLSILNVDNPNKFATDVVINTAGFDLSQEQINVLCLNVSSQLLDKFNVTAQSIPDSELTVDLIKEKFFAMIMYDYTAWMQCHTNTLKDSALRDVRLYIPRLKFIRELSDDEREIFKGKTVDEFDIMQLALCSFIQLQFLPIDLYCAITPNNK